jgi:acetyltransferase-like isoleucine patch superfamily enzyme
MEKILYRIRLKIASKYIDIVLYRWQALVGFLSIQYFKLIFPTLRVGKEGKFWGKVHITIYDDGEIWIGDKAWVVSSWKRSGISLYSPCKLTSIGGSIVIGIGVGLNGTTITSRKRIEIGDGTMIAPNTIIVDTDFHLPWPVEKRWHPSPEDRDKTDASIQVGKNVWIGMNCLVLKGVTIGENSVIAAGSIVTRSLPPNCLAAGNPAVVIKMFT